MGKGTERNAEQEIGNMERTVTDLWGVVGKSLIAKAVIFAFQ